MKYTKQTTMTLAMVLFVMSATGCYNKDKEQIQALYRDKRILLDQKEQLGKDLAESKAKQAQLVSQLDSRDTLLINKQAEITTLETKLEKLEKAEADDDRPIRPRRSERTFTVEGDVLFSSGKATLTSSGRRAMNKVTRTLRDRYSGMPIRIYGHTDSDPIKKSKWRDNLDLSAGRAMAVRRYMVAQGIAAENIESIPMGASKPIASNRTRAGKKKNRRVEIVVVEK